MSELQIEIIAGMSSQFPTPPPTLPQASHWSAAERKEFGTDRTPSGEKIKRPMNAFMVWAQMRRAEITANSTKVHNSLISKALGVEWKGMSDEEKAPYVQKARELRDELFREHPNYVYRPRKRKQRHSAYPSPKSTPAPNTQHSPQQHHTPTTPREQISPESLVSKVDAADLQSIMSPLLLYPNLMPNLATLLPGLQNMSPQTLSPHPLANPFFFNSLFYSQLAAQISKQ